MKMNRRESIAVISAASAVVAASPLDGLVGYASPASAPRVKVGTKIELDRTGRLSFAYPTAAQPAEAVQLADGRIVAYSRICTHMGCPVDYRPKEQSFVCPCHQSRFSARAKGRVLDGPAPRRLPEIALEVDARGDIYAVGISAPPFGAAETVRAVEAIYREVAP
ncbi:MAG: Rieske 2Fe-2S domain-containing protein [Vulcanimicrobiaceae bacterium]